jgi:small subunit ribosomal protein S11
MNIRKYQNIKHKTNTLVAFVYINLSFNNTLITITNIHGKTISFGAGGFLGLKGARRSTAYAGQTVALLLGKKLFSLGFRYVLLNLNGFGSARKTVLKGLISSKLKVLRIRDTTSIAHNGCKSKKKRRI